jgi:hypothetical protein
LVDWKIGRLEDYGFCRIRRLVDLQIGRFGFAGWQIVRFANQAERTSVF